MYSIILFVLLHVVAETKAKYEYKLLLTVQSKYESMLQERTLYKRALVLCWLTGLN